MGLTINVRYSTELCKTANNKTIKKKPGVKASFEESMQKISLNRRIELGWGTGGEETSGRSVGC